MKGNINLYALKQKKNVIQQKLVIHLFEIFWGFFFQRNTVVAQNKKKGYDYNIALLYSSPSKTNYTKKLNSTFFHFSSST